MAKKMIIGAGVALDGEKQFRQAITGINSEMKVLGSELKKSAATFADNNKSVEALTERDRILNEQVTKQKEKVEALRLALENSAKQYGDNDTRTDAWKSSLLDAETELIKLNGEVDSNKEAMNEAGESTSKLGAAMNGIKEAAGLALAKMAPLAEGLRDVGKASLAMTDAGIKTVGKAVSIAADGFKIYTGAVAAAGTAVIALTAKAAANADEINTMSKVTGVSTNTLQKFAYASDTIDVSMDTLTGSLTKLTKNMGAADGGSKGMQDNFKKLGVNIYDVNGNLRDNEDVMNEAINSLGKMTNETERDAMAMEIFGKSAQDLNPLILGGADALKTMGDEAEKAGLIMSQKALDDLNAYADATDKLKVNAGASGNILAGVFAPGLTVATNLVAKMLPQITGSIAGMFSGGNIAQLQGQLTNDLVGMFQGLIDGLMAQLPTFLAGFNGVMIGLTTAIAQVLPGAINSILPVMMDGFIGLIEGLLPLIPVLLPVILDGAVQLFMGLLDGLNVIIPQLMAMMPELIDNLSNIIITNLPLIISAGIQLLTSLIVGITNNIPTLIKAVIALIPVITKSIVDNLPSLIKAGIQLIVALAKGLPMAIPAIVSALPEIISAIIDGLLSVNWIKTGGEIISGIASGLFAGIKNISFSKIGSSLLNGIKRTLGIQSPSKLFRDEVGKNLALGLGIGFGDEMKNVANTMGDAIPTSFDTSLNVSSTSSTKPTMLGSLTISGNNFIINNELDIEYVASELAYMTQRKLGGGGLAYA